MRIIKIKTNFKNPHPFINGWLTGGALRHFLLKQKILDYDYFFKNEKDFKEAIDKLKKNGAILKENLSKIKTFKINRKEIQLVGEKFFKNEKELLNHCDFTITQFILWKDEENIYSTRKALNDLKKKELIIHKITYPLTTLKRAFKYQSRGFSLSNKILIKIADAITKSSPGAKKFWIRQNGKF